MEEQFKKYCELLASEIRITDFYTSSFCESDITFQGRYHADKVQYYREKGYVFTIDNSGYVSGCADSAKIIFTH